ncbi:MAG: tape measure protein [Bacteroidaceae bacterium]|nr:tape measure protein [Bacteroidaceae bacterium]
MASVVDFLIKLQAKDVNVVQATKHISAELEKVEANARNVGASLRSALSFSNFKSSLMSIPGMQFLMNPYTIIGAGIGAVTKLGAEAEMTSVAFNKLVGDEKKAAETLGEIKKFANNTPYETMDLVESAKQMMSFGVSTEETVDKLKRLGDISMGDKNKLSALSLVYSQVASAGKLQGQDFLQFVNAGFNPLQELSAMTGKTVAQLKDMMSKGQIGAKAIAAAIEHATNKGGKFYNMSNDLADTTSGKLSTLMGKISEMATSAYKSIKPFIDSLIDMATWITENIGFVTAIAAAIGTVVIACNSAAIAMSVVKTATFAMTAAQAAWNAVASMSPLGLVITAVGALTIAIVACWNKFAGFRAFMKTMWDTIKGFAGIIKDFLIQRITDLLTGIGKLGSALAKLFKGDFKGAWNDAKDGALKVYGVNAVASTVKKTKDLASGISANYNAHYKAESAKDNKSTSKISKPSTKGSISYDDIFDPAKSKNKKGKNGGRKTASEAATGGTRNTSIQMTIGKFFDDLNVTMMDKADPGEIERIVIQSMNRALAIATSSDR